MEQHYFIGLDIGTTGVKVTVFSTAGNIIAASKRAYPFIVPRPGWAEQEPAAVLDAVVTGVREAVDKAGLAPAHVAAVGLSSVLHSLLPVNAAGQPLTNLMTWADNRSAAQAERLRNSPQGLALYRRTGTPLHPSSPLTKLMWLRQEAPQLFEGAARFISIKEYLLFQLFACYVVDYSVASATGLLNLARLDWDDEALSLAGVRPDQLSRLVPTTHILRGMDAGYAAEMGLAPTTPWVIGAGDGILANLGAGAVEPGQFAVTIGSSSGVRSVAPAPLTDPAGRTFCYALTENRWIIGSPSNTGGMVLRWLHDQVVYPEGGPAGSNLDSYELMVRAAAQIPAGADGLIFLPFLSGERAPYWHADARGVFFGLGLQHGRAHLTRAVLEGILFAVYSIHTALYELAGGPASEARATGGFTRSPLVQQMMADMFGYHLLVPEMDETSSFGAVLLAMYGLGVFSDLAESRRMVKIAARRRPDPRLNQRYRDLFGLYESLYDHLRNDFDTLAKLRQI